MSLVVKSLIAALACSSVLASAGAACAETLAGALAKAYMFNSNLNSARAGVRVTDENVAIAKSGYRPTIVGSGSINYSSTNAPGGRDQLGRSVGNRSTQLTTGSFGVEIRQVLFDGFQTRNNVRAAEARVFASNESLRNTEQNTLFNAASAYMDVIRDRQIAVLTQRNLQFLTEQSRAARSRFEVGEGTRTDVAQADASRASAEARLAGARAPVEASEATYRQLIGDEPNGLRSPSDAKGLPKTLAQAIAAAAAEHPAIISTQHLVDAAGYSVKIAEGALLPQLSADAGLSRSFRETSGALGGAADGGSSSASIGATLSVPLYQGGRTSAVVRQSKESLGQARIEVDVARDQVRAAITSAWSQYIAAKESVSANRALVGAAQLALNGVSEERNVGQRTTLDVLNAQADVITAQINLASSERDVVVASYAILSASGRLSAARLGLQVTEYRPQEHYEAVKDKWFGLRTPDGR